MKKIEVEVPDYMITLPEKELERLKNNFLMNSIKDRVKILSKEVSKAKSILSKYQSKYKMSFEDFEKTGLSVESNIDDHEDYMDWFFWHNVYDKSQKELSKYMLFLENGNEV